MRDPVAYTYNADVHCPGCAAAAGMDLDDDRCVDSEGNPVHAIFAWDETPPEGLYCGDCRGEIVAPTKPTKPARMASTVRIPLPQDLRQDLEREANAAGMSLAAYCRRVLRDRGSK